MAIIYIDTEATEELGFSKEDAWNYLTSEDYVIVTKSEEEK